MPVVARKASRTPAPPGRPATSQKVNPDSSRKASRWSTPAETCQAPATWPSSSRAAARTAGSATVMEDSGSTRETARVSLTYRDTSQITSPS